MKKVKSCQTLRIVALREHDIASSPSRQGTTTVAETLFEILGLMCSFQGDGNLFAYILCYLNCQSIFLLPGSVLAHSTAAKSRQIGVNKIQNKSRRHIGILIERRLYRGFSFRKMQCLTRKHCSLRKCGRRICSYDASTAATANTRDMHEIRHTQPAFACAFVSSLLSFTAVV